MLELLLKLIDRCIDLAKRREEINRKLYEDFVQPAFDNVEAVYKDYSESLRRYRDTIEKTNLWTEQAEQSLVALVTKERLFSEDLLIKLRALSNIETVKLAGLENFVDAVKRFIFVPINSWTVGSADSGSDLDRKQLVWPDHIVRRDAQGRFINLFTPGEYSMPVSEMGSTPRGALILSITDILHADTPHEEKKRRMLRTLDAILEALQVNYALVVNEHMVLRKEAFKLR